MANPRRSRIRVTLIRSPIGRPEPQKRTVRALGLRRLHQSVIHTNTPPIRGMIAKVAHLVDVEILEPEEGGDEVA